MKKVVIIQARMTSTRLPGKVLMDLAGKPMLEQQLKRLQLCKMVDDIVVATTTNSTDDPVVDVAKKADCRSFRGSEHDVLSRYVGAAESVDADVVIRITSDCPLIDPENTDAVIAELINHASECDYTSNTLVRTYPRGLDVEAFFQDALLRMDRLSTSPVWREHVTLSARTGFKDYFLLRSIEDTENNSDLRWTVDAPSDLELVRRIYEGLDLSSKCRPYREVLAYVRANPELCTLNQDNTTLEFA